MAKITLNDITSGYATTTQLNTLFQQVEDELNNKVLYKDSPVGEPNSMANDLDMDSNDILNVKDVDVQSLSIAGSDVVIGNLSATEVETITLTSGQQTVVFTNPTNAATFFLSGNDVDNGRLDNGIDYSVNHTTKTVTLTESYPAGTRLMMVYMDSTVTQTDQANNVTYTPAGVGAVDSDVQTKLRESVSVKDFGAVGDGVTDDTAAIQAAIDSLAPLGGVLVFPVGTYLVEDTSASGYCLRVTSAVKLVGKGMAHTSIKPSATNPLTSSVIRFDPDGNYDNSGAGVESMFIGDTSTGQSHALHGIYCYTNTSTQFLPKFHVNHVNIGNSQGTNGAGIYHFNNVAVNAQGGMYGALIENSTIRGGVTLEGSGDSNTIYRNIISGGNIGINVTLVSGASLLSIIDNNITNDGGAIKLSNAPRTNIIRNNIENYAAGASGANSGCVINLDSSSGTSYSGSIQQNLISIFGASDATKHIRLNESRGVRIDNNTIISGVGGTTGITIENTCQDIAIVANTFNATVATKVSDSGNYTVGVRKDISSGLLNSWVEYSTAETPRLTKDINGVVTLEGTIKSGTVTDGTIILNIPDGYRPQAGTLVRNPCYTLGGVTPPSGRVDIDEAGNMYCYSCGNTMLVLSGITFVAQDYSNAVTAE